MKQKMTTALLHLCLPNLLACAIYYFGRNWAILEVGRWIPSSNYFIHLPDWVKYNAVDGLWLYSLLSAFLLIWGNTKFTYIGCIAFTLFCFFSEYQQYTHQWRGTADIGDVVAYLIAIFLFIFNFSISNLKYNDAF
jgi:hypothetical protein